MNLAPSDPQMLVSPVYLAGHGNPELITGPLDSAPGWGKAVTNTGTHYVSPCQTVHIAHVPGSRYGGRKVLAHREPLGPPIWAASFSRNTPAEITSAFTTTLVDGLRSNHRDYLNGGPKFQPPSPTGALADRGWITDNEAQQYLYQRAPEGHAAFRMRKLHLDEEAELLEQGPPQWTIHACVERENGERWHADFTGCTPLYLVREAVVAFSSTTPVTRALSTVPKRNLSYVQMRRAPQTSAPRQSAALARTTGPRLPGLGTGRPADDGRLRRDRNPTSLTRTPIGGAVPYNPNDERWREYHVSPRYLAGSTFTGDPALRPLLNAGWHLNHDDLGNVYVNSPDQKLRLGYLPEGEDDALWQITAYSNAFAAPRWLVTYQDSAPTEIVAGFTTALARAHAEGPDSYLADRGRDLAELNVGTPLVAAGWSHRYTAADVIFESPDGLAEVHLRRKHLDNAAEMAGNQERWLTLAGPPGHQWYATASSHTPPALVTAMNWALTDPAPVIRYGDDLRLLPPHATATPVTPPAPTPLDVRRAHAARARSPITRPGAARHTAAPTQRQHSLPKIPAQLRSR